MNHLLRKIVIASCIVLTHMTHSVRAEPENAEQPCSSQQGTIRIYGASTVSLDYQGHALLMRFGIDQGMDIYGFDRLEPYRDLGLFELGGESLCTAELVGRGFDLAGTEEAEIVLGTNARDRIKAARGNDTLIGAEGDDVYFYERGDGLDCIQDSAGRTTIRFGETILPWDVTVSSVTSPQDSTLFLRIAPKQGGRASEGLNVRADLSSLSFQFRENGSEFTWSELQVALERDRSDPQALASEQACYFDTQSAERAGLKNPRGVSPHPELE